MKYIIIIVVSNPIQNALYCIMYIIIKRIIQFETSKISFVAMEITPVAMEITPVAMDSIKPSNRSQTKFMTLFYRKTFTELKSIK